MQITEENQKDSFQNQGSSHQPVEANASSAKSRKPESRWYLFLSRIFLGLVLYVLSFGPMYWHWYKAMFLGGDPFLVRLYAPLIWLGQFEVTGDWLRKYVEWWIL